jgi:hypothetical protein
VLFFLQAEVNAFDEVILGEITEEKMQAVYYFFSCFGIS